MRDSLGLYYEMEIKRGNKRVKKYRKAPCHSFVVQFMAWLFSMLTSKYQTYTDISNGTHTYGYLAMFAVSGSGGGFPTYAVGPVVGTGTSAVNISNYQMQTPIANGSSSGELGYSSLTFSGPVTNSGGTSFIITRVFTNSSGSNVTINEIGLQTAYVPSPSTYQVFLTARDIPGSPITLTNGETLTLSYILETSV